MQHCRVITGVMAMVCFSSFLFAMEQDTPQCIEVFFEMEGDSRNATEISIIDEYGAFDRNGMLIGAVNCRSNNSRHALKSALGYVKKIYSSLPIILNFSRSNLCNLVGDFEDFAQNEVQIVVLNVSNNPELRNLPEGLLGISQLKEIDVRGTGISEEDLIIKKLLGRPKQMGGSVQVLFGAIDDSSDSC